MPGTVHELDHGDKQPPPLIGALLRLPFMSARAGIVDQLHAAGFTDLLPAHLAVFQYPGPHGRSPGEIAKGAHVSKQAMNNLLGQLEQADYLTRAVNPENRRERTVILTARGYEAIDTIRQAVQRVEEGWEAALGADRYQQLRSLLEQLNAIVTAQ